MALTRERKNELVAQYVDLLSKTNGFVVVQASGLSVKEIDGLRAAVRNANGKYVVAKNTLLTKALEEAGLAVPSDLLKGPNGIAFGFDNFPGVAKGGSRLCSRRDPHREDEGRRRPDGQQCPV
ncbi:MAG: 50S ribosomal protein L10 [Chloroflexi bacterium]|nr:50S ribosomal protein L10 [Chloroflexota bacterium]